MTRKRGPCSTKGCTRRGERAHGARDIARLAEKTGVFVECFYCEPCMSAAAERSLSTSVRLVGRQQLEQGRQARVLRSPY